MKEKWFNFSLLSEFRNEIYGIAIIEIMIFHFFEIIITRAQCRFFPVETVAFSRGFTSLIGSIGVEVFLLLSGMGMYFSLSKGKVNLIDFYAKRLKRILLPYLCCGLIYWYFMDITLMHKEWIDVFNDLFFISFVNGGVRTFWYIGLIFVLYLFIPFIHILVNGKGRNIRMFLVSLAFVGLYLYLWNTNLPLYKNIEIAFNRIPIFLLGYWFGPFIKEKKPISINYILFFLNGYLLTFINLLEPAGIKYLGIVDMINRFNHSFLGVLVVFGLCIILKLTPEFLKIVLRWFGKYSLELYLVHILLRNYIFWTIHAHFTLVIYLEMIAVSIVLAPILYWCTDKICNIGTKKKVEEKRV